MEQQLTTNIFNQMLNQGETITRVFKPDRKRFWASRLLGHLPLLIFFLPFGAFFLVPALTIGNGVHTGFLIAAISIMVGITILFFLIEILVGRAWYRNRWYCYTNQRIIVQCGIIGMNYRFVQLNQVMNSNVRISFLDRKHGTGTVFFSTMAGGMMGMHAMNMAMMGGSRHAGMGMGFANMVTFLYVKNPHGIMQEIQAAAMTQANNINHMNNQNLANQIGGAINQANQQQGQWGNNQQQGNWNNNQQQGSWSNPNQQQNWGNPNNPNNNNNNNNGNW